MTPAVPAAEFARHAWDFRDAAVGAEHLLGERIEYQIHASAPVACLFGTSIELALRAYLLATNPASARMHEARDLESLYDEASELGLTSLVRMDGFDLKLLRALGALCAKPPAQYAELREDDIFPFDTLKKLCEKLLEIACAATGYEREKYE